MSRSAPTLSLPPRSAFALAACALLVLAFAPAQYFGRQQDDLLYLIGARALASGRYCLMTEPGCPPLTMIDPGLPLLLAPLAFFTERPGVFQALCALLLAAVPVALWAWLRRRESETVALLAAALFASCPLVLAQSGVVMTEAPFTLALIGLLAAAESGRAALSGAAGAALLLLRTAGAGALPGGLAPFLRARSPRALAAAAVPPALVAAGWAAWSFRRGDVVGKLQLVPATYAGAAWTRPLGVAAANARFYLAEWGGCLLPPSAQGGALALALGSALAAAAAYGLFRRLRARPDDPAAWAALATAGMLAFWGWQYERYLIPLLPLLLAALASGLGRAAAPALAVLLALQLGAQTLPRLGKPSPWARPELERTYEWLAAQPRPALLASIQPVRDAWFSGLPGESLPLAGDAASLAAQLKKGRVTYVLRAEGQDYGLEADPASRLRLQVENVFAWLDDARYFKKVHEEPAEKAAVYEPR